MQTARILVIVTLLVAAACGSSNDAGEAPSTTFPPEMRSDRCEVRAHGRTEQGAAPTEEDGYVVLRPDANQAFEYGGRVWIYDTDEDFADARDRIEAAIDAAGCQVVVIHGFSNGAAFAARLACSGETFDGRLAGVVVDDPVTDDSSPDCSPDGDVEVAVYWTGSLPDDGSCAELRWTCAGGDELVGIDEFAARLGATVQASPETEHLIYESPPEVRRWLLGT